MDDYQYDRPTETGPDAGNGEGAPNAPQESAAGRAEENGAAPDIGQNPVSGTSPGAAREPAEAPANSENPPVSAEPSDSQPAAYHESPAIQLPPVQTPVDTQNPGFGGQQGYAQNNAPYGNPVNSQPPAGYPGYYQSPGYGGGQDNTRNTAPYGNPVNSQPAAGAPGYYQNPGYGAQQSYSPYTGYTPPPAGPNPPDWAYYNSRYGAGREEKRSIRRTANQVSWTILACLLMSNLIIIGAKYFLQAAGYTFRGYSQFSGIPPVEYFLLIGFDYVLSLAIPALLYFAIKRIPLSAGIPFQKAGALKVAAYVFFGSAVCILANYPANFVLQLEQSLGFNGDMASYPLNSDPVVLALYFFNIAVIPPIVEELLFRGVVLQSLRRFGDAPAIFASALLFALYHGNFVQIVFAFICGLALAYVDIRTNSLLPSILIHFITNTYAVSYDIIQQLSSGTAAEIVTSTAGMVVLALGFVSLVYLAVREKLFAFRPNRSGVLTTSEKFGAMIGNFGAIAMFLYGLVSAVYFLVRA